jgi:hypothetical protein
MIFKQFLQGPFLLVLVATHHDSAASPEDDEKRETTDYTDYFSSWLLALSKQQA